MAQLLKLPVIAFVDLQRGVSAVTASLRRSTQLLTGRTMMQCLVGVTWAVVLMLASSATEPADALQRDLHEAFRTGQVRIVELTKQVPDREHSQDVEPCGRWHLTELGVRTFFWRAEPITGPEWHHGYNVYGCGYTGTLVARGRTYTFTINVGSTAFVNTGVGAAAHAWIYGCRHCKRLFPSEFWYDYGNAEAG
jgi:hypothetical protein